MMRRHWMLAIVLLTAGLLVPSQALAANTFQVKDAHGRVRGSFAYGPAKYGGSVVCRVVNGSGVHVGTLIVGGTADENAGSVVHAPSASGTGGPTAWSLGKMLYSGVAGENLDVVKATIGEAVPAAGRWQIMRSSGAGFVKVGSVSSSGCSAEAALCAARLLLWPHDATLGVWKVKATSGTHGTTATIWGEQNVNYAGGATDAGAGATVWQSNGMGGLNFVGLVGHEMTENGPVASRWDAWYDNHVDTGYWAERVTNGLYTVVDRDTGHVLRRAVRSTTGPWHLQAPQGGKWKTWETVSRSCPGGWVTGQLALLPLGD